MLSDGANISDPGNYGDSTQNVNSDMVEEVKVQTSNFGADALTTVFMFPMLAVKTRPSTRRKPRQRPKPASIQRQPEFFCVMGRKGWRMGGR